MVKVLWFTFQHFSPRLACYLSKSHLKRDFLDIYITTFCGIPKFENTSAMSVIFVLKTFKNESTFKKFKKNLFFVSLIKASENVAKKSLC